MVPLIINSDTENDGCGIQDDAMLSPMYRECLNSSSDSFSNVYGGDGRESDDMANTAATANNLVRTCVAHCHVATWRLM